MDTWSYGIIGCDDAYDLFFDITEIVVDKFSNEELELYPRYMIPDEKYKEVLVSVYEDLKKFVEVKKSRLAYIVLGAHLMIIGVPIDENLKEKILEYSDWKYEKDQIRNEKHRIERKKNLEEFRETLIKYNGNGEEKIPSFFDTVTSVINRRFDESDSSPIKLKNIDYTIKKNKK